MYTCIVQRLKLGAQREIELGTYLGKESQIRSLVEEKMVTKRSTSKTSDSTEPMNMVRHYAPNTSLRPSDFDSKLSSFGRLVNKVDQSEFLSIVSKFTIVDRRVIDNLVENVGTRDVKR